MSRRGRGRGASAAVTPTRAAPAASSRSRTVGLASLLCALVALGYAATFHAGFVWDDDSVLTANRHIRDADGLRRFWFTAETSDYWPLTSTTLWVEWRLWGLNATPYHVTNLLLHAVESLLLWQLLARLGVPGAYLGALLFAVHPVNVESVAWIAQRKNLVAFLFFELAVLFFLEAEGEGAEPRPWRGEAGRWYAASLLAFLMSLLGKGSTAVLPAVLLVIVWWRRGKVTRADLVRSMPFWGTAIGLVQVNIWFQTHGTGPIRDASLVERVLGAAAAVWFYLGKALWPAGLAFVYPQWRIDAYDLRWWIPLAAALAVTVVLLRLRGSGVRPVLAAWIVYGLALLPVMGLTDVYFMTYSLVADHYQHLALPAATAMVAAAWHAGFRRATREGRQVWIVVAAAVVGILTYRTAVQAAAYRDTETLWRDTLTKNPDGWLAHYNLALLLKEQGRVAEAITHYEQAVRAKPDLPDARVNLGLALIEAGRPAEALSHLEEAARQRPGSAQVRYNFGAALAAAGRDAEAVPHYEEAARLEPGDAVARAQLALSLARLGREDEAVARLEEAVHLDPDDARAHYNLGLLLEGQGRAEDAIRHYEEAVRLQPENAEAHNNLAVVLAERGQTAAAAAHLEEAVRRRGDFIEARMNLVSLHARAGRTEQALAEAQAALAAARTAGDPRAVAVVEDWLAKRGY